MATNTELLEGVRDGFTNLEYGDENRLNELQNRGRMLIRRTFGEKNDYYQRFINIGFHPLVYPTTEQFRREDWEKGRHQSVNLLNTMLEELDLQRLTKPIGGLRTREFRDLGFRRSHPHRPLRRASDCLFPPVDHHQRLPA